MNFDRNYIWTETGFQMMARNGFLEVTDLNPEADIRNRVSRWELFRIGVWLIRRALSG